MNKKLKLMTTMAAISVMVLGIFSGCAKGKEEKASSDYTIKIGYYNCDHMTAGPIAKSAGIYEKMGLKVDMTGNGKVPQAMSAGQMDAGYISISGALNSPKNNVPLVLGANNHEGGSYYLVVSNDVKDPKNLLGKTLGIGSKPQEDLSWQTISKSLSISQEGKDYDAINMNSDKDAYLALKSGQIKGYTACDPWASMAEYENTGKIMYEYKGPDNKPGICCAFTLNKNFISEHKDLAEKLVKAHVEAVKYMYEHPVKSAKIFAETYMVPEEVALMTIYKKTAEIGRTITWEVKPDNIRREIKARQEVGSIDGNVKYEDIIDKDFLESVKVDNFDDFIKDKVEKNFPLGMKYEDWKVKATEIDK